MRVLSIVGAALVLAPVAARPAAAQQVEADVIVRSGPVDGRVIVGQPTRRVVVAERYAPRVIVVDRWQDRRWHGKHKHWKRDGFRRVTVYYIGGRYYDRWDDRWARERWGDRRAVREIVVYERDGRYYLPDRDDDRWDRDRDDD